MLKIIMSVFALFSLFVFNDTSVMAEESNLDEQGKMIYLAPDLDLSSATEEQKQILEEIGWDLEAETPYLEVEKVHTNSEDSNHLISEEEDVVVNLGELFDVMEEPKENNNIMLASISTPIYSPPAHGTKVYKKGDLVHCNRFNGPKTDNKHYAKTKAQAYINFYNSDCDKAVVRGFCTLISDRCNTTKGFHRAWCSRMISHSLTYHKH